MRIGACAPAARILRFMARILPHWPVEHLETIDEVVERYCVASSQGKSRLYVGLGSLFLGFAVIGTRGRTGFYAHLVFSCAPPCWAPPRLTCFDIEFPAVPGANEDFAVVVKGDGIAGFAVRRGAAYVAVRKGSALVGADVSQGVEGIFFADDNQGSAIELDGIGNAGLKIGRGADVMRG